MNHLITRSLDLRTETFLLKMPKEFLNEFEAQMIEWIFKYRNKFSELPHTERLVNKFPAFVPIKLVNEYPLEDVFEIEIKRKRKNFMLTKIAEIETHIVNEDEIPYDMISVMNRVITYSKQGFDLFSSFNRETYFEKKRTWLMGLGVIDRFTGGLQNSDVVYIVGRLASKKTTVLLWLAYKWLNEGARILMISLEMQAKQLIGKIDSTIIGENPLLLRSGDEELRIRPKLKIVQSIAKKMEGEIIIPRQRHLKVSDVKRMAEDFGVDIIMIDGVYLMQGESWAQQDWQRIKSISNDVKQMALTLDSLVLCTTQLRKLNGRKTATAEDIAYGDSMMQDADFAWASMPGAVQPDEENIDSIELQPIKSRQGKMMGAFVEIDWNKMIIR